MELILGCTSWQEAQRVADSLLQKQLVASVEFMESTVRQLYQHAGQQRGIQLIMASLESNFTAIEAEVGSLLTRQNFALQMVPIAGAPAPEDSQG